MSLAILAEIGVKAMQFDQATNARRTAKRHYDQACKDWKIDSSAGYVAKGSSEWDEMLAETKPAYLGLCDAKDVEKNARAKLARACAKAEREMAAGAAAVQAIDSARAVKA